jgi:hypothetical protein
MLSLISLLPLALAAPQDSETAEHVSVIKAALASQCGSGSLAGPRPGELVSEESMRNRDGEMEGTRYIYSLPGGLELQVERFVAGGQLRGLRVRGSMDEDPVLWAAAGPQCQVQAARVLRYGARGMATELLHLGEDLTRVTAREPLNPAVPTGTDPGGVRVALVDSGVNYQLTGIASRLARDPGGRLVGYDFWDLDDRPFDANPAASAFFPQRHGTKTASLLLREAPAAALVPYRYPRSNMSRMADLVAHAARHGVRIVAMPLGSSKKSEWKVFADAAAEHPDMLFIASAGNGGRNIDMYPVYPAALRLANMLTVSSADQWGLPAPGVNWGTTTVDLLTPAEQQRVTAFDGSESLASGSSYAVARIAALAARLAGQRRELDARQLKQAILDRVHASGLTEYVLHGYLPDPLAQPGEVSILQRQELDPAGTAGDGSGYILEPDIVLLEGSGWQPAYLTDMLQTLAGIYRQCDIHLHRAGLLKVSVAPRLLDFDAATASTILTYLQPRRPTIILVRDTLRDPAFEGEAFGRANVRVQDWLHDTVWLVRDLRDRGIALAHELFHVLSNQGDHVETANNLMRQRTDANATRLTADQCERARQTGLRHQLLRQAS